MLGCKGFSLRVFVRMNVQKALNAEAPSAALRAGRVNDGTETPEETKEMRRSVDAATRQDGRSSRRGFRPSSNPSRRSRVLTNPVRKVQPLVPAEGAGQPHQAVPSCHKATWPDPEIFWLFLVGGKCPRYVPVLPECRRPWWNRIEDPTPPRNRGIPVFLIAQSRNCVRTSQFSGDGF